MSDYFTHNAETLSKGPRSGTRFNKRHEDGKAIQPYDHNPFDFNPVDIASTGIKRLASRDTRKRDEVEWLLDFVHQENT